MDRNGLVTVLFLYFIIGFGQSDAFSSRKLVAISDQASPSSSPPPRPPVEAPISKDKLIANALDVESKGVNDAHAREGDNKLDTGKGSETFASEICKKNPICNDHGKTIMACAQDIENGSNNLTLIVQNEQDVDLKVNITFGTSNNNLQTFKLPAHTTETVNITLSGDKSNKVILNAGNGDCELQISQPSPVNSPTKNNGPENTPNVKDANNATESPTKPTDVNNSKDSPTKPDDVNNPADSPTKPKDENDPLKSNDGNIDTPPKSKELNPPPKSKEVNPPPKSKEVDAPPKSKDVDDGSKSKDVDGGSKSKDVDDGSKTKDVDAGSKSKDIDDGSKSKEINTHVSKNNFLDQLTFYSKQVTPIHGAYLAFLIALVIGGSWALCSFRKRRTDGGIRYQELEMGPTESSNAVDVEIAEGWDHDWDDDDWDEDKAIRSPGGSNHAKTISSNGLTSRAPKKDCWDADWDD